MPKTIHPEPLAPASVAADSDSTTADHLPTASVQADSPDAALAEGVVVKRSSSKNIDTPDVPLDDPAVAAPGAIATNIPVLGFFDEGIVTAPAATTRRVPPLSKNEKELFKVSEKVIKAGLATFLAVGNALSNILRNNLYRMEFATFAEYCEKRLGIGRSWAYMQVDAAEAMKNLSTIGGQLPLPSTERQLRPLAGLKAQDQVAAWKRAVAKAAGAKVSGATVEEAVRELTAPVASKESWSVGLRDKLVAAGYETEFEQPVKVRADEWIDLLDATNGVYVKLIDKPDLSNLAICLAMRERGLKCQVIVNGASLGKKLEVHRDGSGASLGDPLLGVFLKTLGAYIEHGGKLYAADSLDDRSHLELKLSEGEETQMLGAALEAKDELGSTQDVG